MSAKTGATSITIIEIPIEIKHKKFTKENLANVANHFP